MAGFASWLFGLPVQQPREYRRLMRIRSRVYTPDREAGRRDRPLGRADPVRPSSTARRSRRCGPAPHWGKVFDCAWLHITGDVPAGVDDPVVMLGIRGEGLVHSADGRAPRLGEHRVPAGRPAAQRRPVPAGANVDTSIGRGSSSSPTSPTTAGSSTRSVAPSTTAHISRPATTRPTRSTTTTSPCSCWPGRPRMPRSRPSCGEPSRDAYARFTKGDLAGARAALADRLSAPSTSDFVYSAVGHGHLDMAWLWPLRETRRKAARTYVRALNTIDRRDDYIYGTSQPQQMAWMKQRHPALFERMRRAVADGRMELQGSFWVEPDTNLPSGESLVRQALVGRRFLQEEFGLTDDQLRLCWLPDTFGYNGNLPQILREHRDGLVPDHQARVEQGQRLPAPQLPLAGHRRIHACSCTCRPRATTTAAARPTTCSPASGKYPETRPEHGPARLRLGRRRRRPERDPPRGHAARAEPARASAGGVLVGRRLLPVRSSSASIAHTHVGELYLETHQGTYTTQGADQAAQPPRRAQAARGRGARRAHGRRQPARARGALARRAAEPVPRHPPRLVDRARQPRGDRDLRAHRGGRSTSTPTSSSAASRAKGGRSPR